MAPPPYRVLIVDDSTEDRVAYRRLLATDHYVVDEADCAKAALARCEAQRPDCILLDFNLPDQNGVEVIEALGKLFGDSLPAIVVLTGHGSEEHAVAAMKSGALDYLVKGVSRAEVSSAIKTAISNAALRQENRKQAAALEAQSLQLIEAARMKDKFLATLAHELRNPLAPVRTATAVLAKKYGNLPEVVKYVGVIERQTEHLKRIVDDLLDVARINTGKLELQRQQSSLSSIIDSVVDQVTSLLDRRSQTLRIDKPAEAVDLDVDRVRLVQTLVNVIANSSKFSPEGASIELAIGVDAPDIEFEVRDHGVGLEAPWLGKIFDLFTQGGPPGDKSTAGLGIGLSLARQFTELHGGTIEARSEGLGKAARSSFAFRSSSRR